jgi:hypothetical protein
MRQKIHFSNRRTPTFMGTRLSELLEGTSMQRIRRNPQYWRARWPWRWFVNRVVNEHRCKCCGQWFQEGDMPEPVKQFTKNDVGAQIFPAGSFRRGAQVLRIGRWKPSRSSHELGLFIPLDEIEDLVCVIENAKEHLVSEIKSRARRR